MHWSDEDPGLPIKLGPCSNAEYEPEPHSPVITETIRRAREECDRNARRLGMGRREFLLSAMGAATTLLVLDACTKELFQQEHLMCIIACQTVRTMHIQLINPTSGSHIADPTASSPVARAAP